MDRFARREAWRLFRTEQLNLVENCLQQFTIGLHNSSARTSASEHLHRLREVAPPPSIRLLETLIAKRGCSNLINTLDKSSCSVLSRCHMLEVGQRRTICSRRKRVDEIRHHAL